MSIANSKMVSGWTSPSSQTLPLLSLSWNSSLSPFKQAKLSDKELNWFRSFSCREAQCFKPSDRAFVMNAIREEFGSENEFDKFVQTQLPKVLAVSKHEYSTQLVSVASEALQMVFGT